MTSEAKNSFSAFSVCPVESSLCVFIGLLQLIGFAGPRIVKETIGKDLPKGFQTSEFVMEHGFLDFIVNRKDLKAKITQVIGFFEG